MNQSFYAAAVAASQQQQRLNVTANNLANVNTAGFKAEQANFSDLLYRNWTGPDNAQLPRGSGSRMIQTTTDFATGALQAREDGQNYAIEGDGFFALRNPETGETSYTRAGAFHWGSVMQGEQTTYYLCNAEGYYVLDQNQQPIALGQDPEGDYQPGVFDFANTDGMLHLGNNRFAPVAKNGPVLQGEGNAIHGMLEMSNTDIGTEFAKVIEAQRSFSYALKMVQTQDEIESTINSLRN